MGNGLVDWHQGNIARNALLCGVLADDLKWKRKGLVDWRQGILAALSWQKQTTKVHVLRMKLEDMPAHLAVAAAAAA